MLTHCNAGALACREWGTAMRKGDIDCVIVGADRITRDAVFNKIGTYMHAVCAKSHDIPFFVAAPMSTFDSEHIEEEIEIEEREREEVADFAVTKRYRKMSR